eukprot:g81690.t1
MIKALASKEQPPLLEPTSALQLLWKCLYSNELSMLLKQQDPYNLLVLARLAHKENFESVKSCGPEITVHRGIIQQLRPGRWGNLEAYRISTISNAAGQPESKSAYYELSKHRIVSDDAAPPFRWFLEHGPPKSNFESKLGAFLVELLNSAVDCKLQTLRDPTINVLKCIIKEKTYLVDSAVFKKINRRGFGYDTEAGGTVLSHSAEVYDSQTCHSRPVIAAACLLLSGRCQLSTIATGTLHHSMLV